MSSAAWNVFGEVPLSLLLLLLLLLLLVVVVLVLLLFYRWPAEGFEVGALLGILAAKFGG